MIPAIIEQYIERLNSQQSRHDEKENCRYVLAQTQEAISKAIEKYDAKRR